MNAVVEAVQTEWLASHGYGAAEDAKREQVRMYGTSLRAVAEHDEIGPLELLLHRFDGARTARRRAKVAYALIDLGASGIEELCYRAMSESAPVGDEIVALLAGNAGKTGRFLRELVGTTHDRGAERALEEIARRRALRSTSPRRGGKAVTS